MQMVQNRQKHPIICPTTSITGQATHLLVIAHPRIKITFHGLLTPALKYLLSCCWEIHVVELIEAISIAGWEAKEDLWFEIAARVLLSI